MPQTIIALVIWFTTNFQIDYGHPAYYNEGVMEAVIAMRQSGNTASQLPEELPYHIGAVASDHCDDVGQLWWLWHEGPPESMDGPYLVADCCTRINGDCDRMREKDIIVEVDYQTAVRWETVGWSPYFINVSVIKPRMDRPTPTPHPTSLPTPTNTPITPTPYPRGK